ncbi:DUF2142 domain-containing protein [Lactococcus termiticola]|uniref:Membrane protein n=1 Tax=Lactococcus termiticola TaxID=2169526 RepID=A0A2R5HES2_9LACT|nr:DUF2142 domain-containing protein [Lactococcus termiticola]GBG96553.1 membrane protein [Lactococcus termiticola]
MRTQLTKRWSKPENIFLLIGAIFCLAFSLFQPLFIEPDASYHFDSATYISHTVVDRASVGMPTEDYMSEPTPFDTVTGLKRNHTYFSSLFVQKLPVIPRDQVIDKRVINAGFSYTLMHLVPAIGVKLGHAIYPSVGVMIVTARLLNSIVFLLGLYFIIKKVKAYKRIFVFVSLTPTVIQLATSLSYDNFNYLIFAAASALLVNLSMAFYGKAKIDKWLYVPLTAIIFIGLYFSKTNSKLLFIPLMLLVYAYIYRRLKSRRLKQWMIYGPVLLIFIGLIVAFFKIGLSQIKLEGKQLTFSLLEPYYTVLTTEVISGTNTVGLPAWLFPIQYLALALVFLTEKKEGLPKAFAWTGLGLVVLNFFGIMFQYAGNSHFVGNVITGPQGRYFTPYLLLLAPVLARFGGWLGLQPKGIEGEGAHAKLQLLAYAVSVVSLIVCLGLIVLKFYWLQLPADEFRSGISHYIFR